LYKKEKVQDQITRSVVDRS